ncbi:MAG: ATP-binding protein [Actinomycetota bacterium]
MEGSEVRPLFDINLPARPSAASQARRSLSVLAGQMSEEIYEDVRILVTELVTNSVRHSGSANDDDVRIVIWTDPLLLRVEVADSGSGFEKIVKPSSPDQCGGWGLQIVDRLSDRWGVKRTNGTGSAVWFEIDTDRRGTHSGIRA